MDVVIGLILVLFGGALFIAIIADVMPHGGGGIASLTAFHDMQPKDKQEAVQVIIDQKAGKRRFDQGNEKPEKGEESHGRTEGNT